MKIAVVGTGYVGLVTGSCLAETGNTVTCVDVESGKSLWTKRVEGNYFASPVRIGDRIFGVSDIGEVVVLSATKDFKELGRNPLGEETHSTPAISGGRMYFRTYSHLISLGGGSS